MTSKNDDAAVKGSESFSDSTALLGPSRPVKSVTHAHASGSWTVLHRSPHRNRCQDWPWIVPFLGILAFVLYFGIRGTRLLSDPAAFCKLIPSNALDSSIPSTSDGSDVYDGCVHYIIIGDLQTARSQCVVYAVSKLVGGTGSTQNNSRPGDVGMWDGSHASLERRASVPTIVSTVFTVCVSLLVSKASNGPEACMKFALGTVISSTSGLTSLFTQCLSPVLSQSASATSGCVDFAIHTAFPSTPTNVYTNCKSGSSPVVTCVNTAISSVAGTNSALSDFMSSCVQRAVDSGSSPTTAGIVGCVEYIVVGLTSSSASASLSRRLDARVLDVLPKSGRTFWEGSDAGSVSSSLSSPAVSLASSAFMSAVTATSTQGTAALGMVSSCVSPFLNGTTDALGAASHCVETVLTNALGSADQVYQLIVQAVQSVLGFNVADLFNNQCMAKTIKDVSSGNVAGGGVDLVNCLFKGAANKFCRDVVMAGPRSIASALSTYFGSFRERVSQSAIRLTKSFLVVTVFGVLMATTWMAVVTLFGEGLIWFSIGITLLNLTALVIINFVIMNIPGAVILLIYLVFKIAWYIWTWRKVKFAADVLHVSLRYLRKEPQPFVLATLIFLWNAGWCYMFAAAYLDLYSPDIVPGDVILNFSIVLLVFGFFWSFEVWKGCLGTSIAGTMATWYYFRRDGEASSFYAQSSTENDGSRAQITSPMTRSFFQTITKSFGTICLSSILLALLKTLHYLYRRSKNSKNAWVRAILNALLSCVESILRVFNLYALVRVGVRHEKYCDAAMATWELIKQRGVEALVNDDCVDIVMGGGRWIGAVTLAGVGFIASKIAYKLDWDIAFMVTVVSFFFGFSILSVMAVTVEMSAVTLFVLLAENPEAMLLNHPIMCRRLVHVIIDRCEAEGWVVPDEIKELAAETGQPLRRGI